MSKDFGKVALLQGGTSPERDISLLSAKMVGEALDSICEEVVRFDTKERPVWELADMKVDAAFNILHGGEGENGVVQAALELMKVPYTGSRHLACALALDKDLCKTLWLHEALATPMWTVATDSDERTVDRIHLELGRDLFVKPNNGGSSIATRRVSGRDDLAEAIDQVVGTENDRALVEQSVDGVEITYAIVGDEILPGIRIEVESGFYDYDAKYVLDTTELICPPQLTGDLDEAARSLSLEAFRALGCEGWGRVDLMASGREVFLLEVNTIPGMTDHSLVPRAAREMGWDMPGLCGRILGLAR